MKKYIDFNNEKRTNAANIFLNWWLIVSMAKKMENYEKESLSD